MLDNKDYQSSDDATLVEQVVAGDLGAWEQLVERYTGYIHSIASNSGLQQTDRDDIAQETWMAVFKYLNSFDMRHGNSFKAWLGTIAKNTCCKAAVRNSKFGKTNDLNDGREIPSNTEEPAEQVIRDENQAIIVEIIVESLEQLRLLPEYGENYYQFALLKWGEELDYETIAQKLQITIDKARQWTRQVSNRLRTILEEAMETYPSVEPTDTR